MVTGDYSRGARTVDRRWRATFPVQEITIAGNLKDMLGGIEMIGKRPCTGGHHGVADVKLGRNDIAVACPPFQFSRSWMLLTLTHALD